MNTPPRESESTSNRAVRETAGGDVGLHPASQPDSANPPTTIASGLPNQPHPAAGGIPARIGDYAILKKIGEGGMGAVYLAEDTRLGRKAAIKMMKRELAANPHDHDRFMREARAAAAVEHDNIVPIWGVGEAADGTPFIAMPFLQGEMLEARLKREPVSPLGLILKVAREVSQGLAAAHASGLIHRDIKPANIWLEGDPSAAEPARQIRRCKLLDFGLARSLTKDEAQLTASGAILGTPAYMAPEQARGERVDPRADLFSLGVTLYRMAAGRPPFGGATPMAVLIALATETPTPVRELAPNLPPELAELIDRMLNKNPDARPQSAEEVAASVRQIVKDLQAKKLGVSASPPASPAQPVMPYAVVPLLAPNPWEDVAAAEYTPPPSTSQEPRSRSRQRSSLLPAIALLALAAAAVLAAAVIIHLQTTEGTLIVEISDPAVEARFKNGKLVLIDADGKERYTIAPTTRDKKIDAGEYTIHVEGADGVLIDTREFVMRKYGQVVVRVTLDPSFVKAPPQKKEEPKATEPDNFVQLFNGNNLTGWVTQQGSTGNWKVVGGAITCTGPFDHLYTESGDFSDFHLRAEVKINQKGNSGIYFRAGKPLAPVGDYEAQISLESKVQLTGSLYNRVQVNETSTKADTWFLYEIIAEGNQIRLLVDGKETARYTDPRPDRPIRGYIALQHHDPDTTVFFRSIAIRPIKAAADLSADRKAAEWVLSVKGTVGIDHGNDAITEAAKLPKDAFQLTDVYVATPVRDADLALFKGCKHVKLLYLVGSGISNEGLAHFSGCKDLTSLNLAGTRVDSAAAATIKQFAKLTDLIITETAIGEQTAKELAKALPGCRIQHNGGTIDPREKSHHP